MASSPKPNAFPIPEDQAYARTDVETANIAEFLLTKLEPVGLESLDAGNRLCIICLQEFHVSDIVKLSHAPVKTICSHVFGKTCIIKWLDPLCYWGRPEHSEPDVREMANELLMYGKANCPSCRRVFFPRSFLEPMELLAARLWFWDVAYSYVGVARSEKEEHSRRVLWKYVKYCREINGMEFYGATEYKLLEGAQMFLWEFARTLKNQALTPVQEALRGKLQTLGEINLRELISDGGRGTYFSYISQSLAFETDSESEPPSADATIRPCEDVEGEVEDDRAKAMEGEEDEKYAESEQSDKGREDAEHFVGYQPDTSQPKGTNGTETIFFILDSSSHAS